MRQFPDNGDLPQDMRRVLLESAFVDQEVRRLEGLAARRARVETQVGKQAILGGDAREHRCAVAFGAGPPYGFMTRVDEHSGVTVEGGADFVSRADEGENFLHHLVVSLNTRLALAIEREEVLR